MDYRDIDDKLKEELEDLRAKAKPLWAQYKFYVWVIGALVVGVVAGYFGK